jgi:hypothetical protein
MLGVLADGQARKKCFDFRWTKHVTGAENSVVLLRQRNFMGLMKCLGYDSSLWKAGQTGF